MEQPSGISNNLEQAVQIIQNLKEPDWQRKISAIGEAAVYVERYSYFPEGLTLLLQLVEQEEFPRLAMEACWALWKFKDKSVVPVLLEKARRSPYVGLREKAIRALGLLEATEALPLIREAGLKTKAIPMEKAAALAALGFFKEKEDLFILEKALKDLSPLVRKEALCSLGRFLRKNRSVFSWVLIGKIYRRSLPQFEKLPEIRIEALMALCQSNEGWTDRILRRAALKDPSERVRQKAFYLLKDSSAEGLEFLCLEGLKDISWSVRYNVSELLSELVLQKKVAISPEIKEALDTVLFSFPTDHSATQKAMLARRSL